MKKRYVASDHLSKILRSLQARWRPKFTAIEEAKDLNTLSVKDLVSSLKVHEIGLNEHEPARKVKSIALPLINYIYIEFHSIIELPLVLIILLY